MINAELERLHATVQTLADLCERLAADKRELATRLAESEAHNAALTPRLDMTRTRIESLIARLPEVKE